MNRPRLPRPGTLLALCSLLFATPAWPENEVGFLEKFAFAPDREKVLGELLPGSEDYYFFHALHAQHTRNERRLAEVLDQWRKRMPDENPRRRVIENREALLDYEATPQQTLDYLKERLNVQFNHERETTDQKPNLPTALDAKLIARAVFEEDALKNDDSLDSLSLAALESLVAQKTPLPLAKQRAILDRLQRPDVPGLADLVISELRSEDSGGFGAFTTHANLLPAQLDAIAKAVPDVLETEEFVHARLRKLAPSADVDIERNAAEREAWLDRVWAYAKTLPPAFNTIKARILYARLDHDRKKGVYDQARFLDYLKLPRNAPYVEPKWIERVTAENPPAEFETDLREVAPHLKPLSSDEELVREYFFALFHRSAAANAVNTGELLMKPYLPYVLRAWLRPILAEALILGGHGNPERWASLLTPAEFQQLKERVDIRFPKTNAEQFAPGADVAIDVLLKNTPKLLVKIYELNALNIFLTQKRQLNTDLAIDGLIPHTEQTHTFDSGPFRRTRHTFQFPELKDRRGAWIVEFIGGGQSSRALIRAGQWQLVQHTGPSGDLLTVLDETGKVVPDAVAWLDGRKYTRDEKLGAILVPFTSDPATRQVVLASADGSFATLAEFYHHQENYQLDVQFHIAREQLLAGKIATLAARVGLLIGDAHLDPALLQEPQLTITATTQDGISSTQVFSDLEPSVGAVLTQSFQVPENVATLTAQLTGKIEKLSAGGEKEDLRASERWEINEIDATPETNQGHLSRLEGNYVYELLGKNGEPLPEQAVTFEFHHRGFDRPQRVTLKTDAKGRVLLGPLPGIAGFKAEPPNGRVPEWELETYERAPIQSIHLQAGQPARVPAPAGLTAAPETLAREVSLLQEASGTFTADLASKLKLQDGFLIIEGLAPGDYTLRFRSREEDTLIRVTAGAFSNGWLLSPSRSLEVKGGPPLQIAQIVPDAEFITIRLANAGPFARVHVAASRFVPSVSLFDALSSFDRFDLRSGTPAWLPNLYTSGRSIGDEYRYILERRNSKTFPGNMLTRPGLLLNPWEIRETDLQALAQSGGEAAQATEGDRDGAMGAAKAVMAEEIGTSAPVTGANLDFLATAAPVLYNLLPDKDGVVRIERRSLGDRQHVQVYAENLTDAVWQSFALPEAPTKFADRRLAQSLDPAKPHSQRKEVTVLTAGRALTIEDTRGSELQIYDTLGGVFGLFRALNPDPKLAEFAWVLEWPKLKPEDKRAKYSEFACHELSMFLWRKDPAFFNEVIRPYLANKKDKTFIDDFLVGADLSSYLEPSRFLLLNAAERALLASRIKDASANISREARERWELLPPNPALQDRLFTTALRGETLDVDASRTRITLALDPANAPAPGTAELAYVSRSSTKARNGAEREVERQNRPELRALEEKALRGVSLSKSEFDRGSSAHKSGEFTEADLPALANQMKELGDRPIVAGNRSGNLAISANAVDALLFGSAPNLRTQNEGDVWAIPGLANPYSADQAKEARAKYRALYRQAGTTKEWAENNYHKLRITEQNAALIPVNAFWRDYAAWVAAGGEGAFLSANVAEAHRNFSEIMLALAVLDLPFEAEKHTRRQDGTQLTITAAGPIIAFHQQVKSTAPAEAQPANPGLLVSQSFFRHGDRHRMEGNEQFEKNVTTEFLAGAVYGATVVVTNPTSAPLKGEVLLQVPQGAIPVLNSKPIDSRRVQLAPYTTQRLEYHFYFPSAQPEPFLHFPVSVGISGREGALGAITMAPPFKFRVVPQLTEFDKASWDYVSQHGSAAEVLAFLQQNNAATLNLERIAWRCRDADFFRKVVTFLRERHVWDSTVYSYALLHNDSAALNEWLQHQDDFVRECGPWFSSKLAVFDPVARRSYEHLEYSPLVNQRAHRLGNDWRIANPAVRDQYRGFLNVLAHKPQLDGPDHLGAAYYLFLQDRVEEALPRLQTAGAAGLPTRLQHDYLRCYALLCEGNTAEARGLAAGYANHPVPRWRNLFQEVTAHLDEAEGRKPGEVKPEGPNRENEQSALTATEPALDFKVENRAVSITWKNLSEATVNYYLLDPEFSFSSNPFATEDGGRFTIIKPRQSSRVELPRDKTALEIRLPAEFAQANVLIEIVGAGLRKTQVYHANKLRLNLTANYGRLEARDAENDRPIGAAYVKVYAKLKGGTVRFFKDGYTDLRGRFDYASLNGRNEAPAPLPTPQSATGPRNGVDYQMLKPAELSQVEKLAILVLSEKHGATTREVDPPRE